jgi:hypothetical protein
MPDFQLKSKKHVFWLFRNPANVAKARRFSQKKFTAFLHWLQLPSRQEPKSMALFFLKGLYVA